jgi:hypothetical protein
MAIRVRAVGGAATMVLLLSGCGVPDLSAPFRTERTPGVDDCPGVERYFAIRLPPQATEVRCDHHEGVMEEAAWADFRMPYADLGPWTAGFRKPGPGSGGSAPLTLVPGPGHLPPDPPGRRWRLAAIPETLYADVEAYEEGVLIVDRHPDATATVYLYGHRD